MRTNSKALGLLALLMAAGTACGGGGTNPPTTTSGTGGGGATSGTGGGATSSGGGSGGACNHGCPSIGATRCNGSSVESCAADTSGCRQWVTQVDCAASGRVCDDGASPTACKDLGAPTCSDKIKNQDETDVDCGGAVCNACAVGKTCQQDADCASNTCEPGAKTCLAAPTCNDGAKNAAETDVDCGGGQCPACAVGQSCQQGGDCITSLCDSGTHKCLPTSTCNDNVKNQDETDVDCGGAICGGCALGKGCLQNGDCTTGLACNNGSCQTACQSTCTTAGEKQCQSNATVTCGDYNQDGCLEWGPATSCASTEICANGACQAAPPPAKVLINEVVYDSVGADTETFVELHGPAGLDLTGYKLVGVNGNGGTIYNEIALVGSIGADGFFVVAHPSASAALKAQADQLDAKVDYQNGPDSIQLQWGATVVDALGYGTFGASDVFAGEGQAAVAAAVGHSLGRDAQHTDTDVNLVDFTDRASPTPRASNEPAPAICGNGLVETGETCDGNCPTTCDDANACTADALTGAAASCNVACTHQAITQCISGDGCCAPGCNATNDTDCSPACGNGVVEAPEICDGNCPISCDDGNACTADAMTGSAALCSAACTHQAITQCISNDGCCPAGCTSSTDNDCPLICLAGEHICNNLCVSDASTATCGTSCNPCPVPTNGTATCSNGTCGFACNVGYSVCGSACCSNTITAAQVSAGDTHTCGLTTSGGVKCWGRNFYGQLGSGSWSASSLPVDVSGLTSGVAAIAAGGTHTCAITTSGGVKCWGGNAFGQLGDGTTADRNTPVDVSGLSSGVVAITVGFEHTCALTTSGGIKCWGLSNYGQLGNGDYFSRNTPTDVSGLTSGVAAVAAGEEHTCAITTSGGAKCWGRNGYGQLGNGNTNTSYTLPGNVAGLTSGVTALELGQYHTCALTTSGGVKCWGYNNSGQLGDGTATSSSTPVDVSGLASGGASVGAGSNHSCALTTASGVKCWGSNNYGQFGDGGFISSGTPVDSGLTSGVAAIAVGANHTCALTTSGGVNCWGYNYFGQLGNGSTLDSNSPVNVTGF